MEEKVNSDKLELKIRVIKGEIRENKREKDKYWDIILTIVLSFIGLVGVGFYYFFTKKEMGTAEIILAVILLLLLPVLGFYWYNKYKSTCQKIEQLERELELLKKGLKEE